MTRRSQFLAFSLLSCFLTASLIAALSPELAEFGTGPARHLMTKADQKQWKGITTDQEAQAFIDLFWARRDPTPDTAENEYRAEFEGRVQDADTRFTTKKTRGALSDRGKILILLGPPTKILEQVEGSGIDSSGDPGVGKSVGGGRKKGRTQTWQYSGKELPPGTKFSLVEINFWDANSRGEYELSVSGSATGGGSFARALAFEAIGSAVNRAIVSPELKEPRKFAEAPTVLERTVPVAVAVPAAAGPVAADTSLTAVSTSLKSESFRAAIDKALATADAADGTVVWREFEAGEDGVRTGLHLNVASTASRAGAAVKMFGSIADATGKVVKDFEEPARVRESAGDLFVDRAVMLPPGRYDAVLGIAAADGAPLVVGRTSMDVIGDDGKPSVRELVLTSNLQPLSVSQLDDAFAMGGMKVVPKANGAFKKDDRLWYVFQVRNPSRGDGGTPRIRVSVVVHGTEESTASVARRTAEKEVMTNELGEDGKVYWIGNSIPLASFTPGKYEVLINVTDAISNAKFTVKDSFSIE